MITKNYKELVPISNEIVDALIEGKEVPVGSPRAVLETEKIPGEQWHEMIAFFKAVYHKHKSEAMAYWFYNKETLQWLCDVPIQEVKGASVEVDSSRLDFINSYRKAGWDFMMSIHTHGSMSAGQSGQDEKDEHDDKECALHITLGRMDEKYADWHCRAMVVIPAIKDGRPTGEKAIQACVPFCITNLLNIEGLNDDMPSELKTWLIKYHAMEQITKEFPKEWMERVSEKKYYRRPSLVCWWSLRWIECRYPRSLAPQCKRIQPSLLGEGV